MSRVHEPITSPSGIRAGRRTLTLAAAAVALSASACGSDSRGAAGPTETRTGGAAAGSSTTTAASPSTTAATPTKTAPDGGGSTTTTTTPTATTPSVPQEGTGEIPGGDERGNRVPVSFTVTARALKPATVSVPPFLGIELRVTSGDGAAHTLTLRTSKPVRVRVPASGTVSRRVGGLRDGRYKVDADGGSGRAVLIVGDAAVGP